ncbi:tetratricopeptide repeat protein [Mucilaginibacter sp. HMF5004]|uniref:ATP-binding protein n=1 Tax=Mucilaginibacter rivuli TaxID=2857527 RepID=UPI001C5DB2D8|nr:ATP-binding protein [Mucilaginibacter rivuli]MBW4890693.1 tetratricopeptide repeat protein [Mucilaginibacter rivuli]
MKRQLLLFSCLLYFPALAQQAVPALQARLKTAPDSEKTGLYIAISNSYAESQPDSAVEYANRGMRLAEKRNDRHGQALLLLQLGTINQLHHHTDLARRFENEALSVFRNLNDRAGMARAYDELALIDGEQNTGLAKQDLEQALRYQHDAHDSSGVLETYHNLGSVYEEKGETEKALSYYLRELVQYEHRKQEPEAYFLLLEHIGKLYLKKGDKNTAIRYLQQGVLRSGKQEQRDTQINLLDEEARIYAQEGDKAKALTVYKQALQEAKRYNRPEQEAQTLVAIAGVLEKSNAAASLKDLREALAIAKKLKEPQLEARIYDAMSGVYKQEKDYKEALSALNENRRLVDSLLGSDTSKDIAALDSSYALESSREKIDHLKLVNKEAKWELDSSLLIIAAILVILTLLWFYLRKTRRLNEELKTSNRVKDTLFSVIGHDLKGPAGSAAQLFAMMETEDFTEEEMRGMIAELRKQTTASFELLNALFEWGRAQLQGVKVKPETFDPELIVIRNIDLLAPQAALKQINITPDIRPGLLVYADTDHVDFVVRNLLSNAIKFTYEGGQISVAVIPSADQREVVFEVKDSGTGISAERQKEFMKTGLQVSFGTKGEKGSGLGLLLTKDFIIANRGRIWLESMEGNGTTFYFALPSQA